jgi:catechol 2,3-dioxygenase-like lactoylglutathione lyase family enzyme
MRLLRLLALFLFPALGLAQAPPTTILAGIAHVAIRVSDLARARDFYHQLGFEQAFTLSKDGKTTQAFLKVNDRQFIELYPQSDPSQSLGFLNVCFESWDLQALHRAYLSRELTPSAVKQDDAGNLLFTMVGPEQQDIEFTQYMPGSLQTKDKGRHLGANPVSKQIAGVSLRTEDPVAARTFYELKLGFHESLHPLEPGLIPLLLPGPSGQLIEITPGAYQIFFAVPSLWHASSQLKALHLSVQKQGSMLTVQDPDGNRIVFATIEPETGRKLLQMPKIPWITK